jgi:STAS domain
MRSADAGSRSLPRKQRGRRARESTIADRGSGTMTRTYRTVPRLRYVTRRTQSRAARRRPEETLPFVQSSGASGLLGTAEAIATVAVGRRPTWQEGHGHAVTTQNAPAGRSHPPHPFLDLKRLIDESTQRWVRIDCSTVGAPTFRALRMLIALRCYAAQRGRRIVLVHPTPEWRRLVECNGLGMLLGERRAKRTT